MNKKKLKYQQEELEKHERFLEKLEANYDYQILKLREEINSIELVPLERKGSEQRVLGLVKEQEREKQALHKKIIELEKQIDQRQALALGIEQLKAAAQVMEHMGRNAETKKRVEAIKEDLKDKEEELNDLKDLVQTMIVVEKKSHDELQDGRKAMIDGLRKRKHVRATIGIKLMGLLDEKVFENVAKQKYSKEEACKKANDLFSLCKGYIEDLDWHPFKILTECGTSMEVINEEDERLKDLRNEHGEEVWRALTTALGELNECNASGQYAVPELWNFKEDRKARLGEGAEYIVNLLRSNKKKKSSCPYALS